MQSSLQTALNRIFIEAAKRRASTIHLSVNSYPTLRIDQELVELKNEEVISPTFMTSFSGGVLDEPQGQKLQSERGIIFIKEFEGKFRFKINLFYQKNFLAATLRLIPNQIPTLANLGLPKVIYSFSEKKSGLIVVAGPYSSGRTTTAAAIVEEINKERSESILTIEKTIEYIFVNKKSLIEQREVGRDVKSFSQSLEYCRETDVNIINVDANEEKEAIPLILDLADSGKLVIYQMDTMSVMQAIEEIINAFPDADRQQAQNSLAGCLEAIVVQRLVPKIGGGLVPASEVLIATAAVSSLIREGRLKQITTVMQSSRAEGMITLDQSLADLVKGGDVLVEKAVEYAQNPENLRGIAKA